MAGTATGSPEDESERFRPFDANNLPPTDVIASGIADDYMAS